MNLDELLKMQKQSDEECAELLTKLDSASVQAQKNTKEASEKTIRVNRNADVLMSNAQKLADESGRVADIAENCTQIMEDLDRQFEKQTGLTKTDIVFLFIATGLQIARQYLLSNDKFRIDSKAGDKLAENALSAVPPKWQDVLLQSVPYDAISRGSHVSDSTGLSGTTHRYRTLGHDPVLGWIFGTANIMTNSLTKYNFETYQVKHNTIIRHYPSGTPGMLERAVVYSKNEPMLLAASVARQAVHFGSDYFTKQGLPIPVISTVNNDLAKNMLTKWNIDMWSVTRGAAVSVFINQLIAIIHRLFYTGNTERERSLYEVRTRKILSYSNLIASTSNLLWVGGNAALGNTNAMKQLDIGGLAVTIYRLITDRKFIRKVKEEFIYGSMRDMIMGDDLKLGELEEV